MKVKNNNSSHKQILKATSIFGGAKVFEIIIRILRNKIIAILLGPTGVGFIGIYQSFIDLMRNATGFGLSISSVRDIAEASGTGDLTKISRTITILNRWVWFTGLLGMFLTIFFSKFISRYAFGNENFANSIAILSSVLLLVSLSDGQLATLQGLRKIQLMAKANVFGLLTSFIFAIPLYWIFGLKGIVPVFILSSLIVLIYTNWYYKKVNKLRIKINFKEFFLGGIGMIRLGFLMVSAGIISTLTMFYIRTFIIQNSSIEYAGQFQAAYSLSAMYLSAVLGAMAADYFPRLCAVNNDNKRIVKLVNEQTEIALLLASPLVIGMISFSIIIVNLLFSGEFNETITLSQWMFLGTYLQLISWPIGYIFLSKSMGGIFILCESFFNLIFIAIALLGWHHFNLEAIGISYFLSHLISSIILFLMAFKYCKFLWSSSNLKHIIIFCVLVLSAFFSVKYLTFPIVYFANVIFLFSGCVYSIWHLKEYIDINNIFNKISSYLNLKRK